MHLVGLASEQAIILTGSRKKDCFSGIEELSMVSSLTMRLILLSTALKFGREKRSDASKKHGAIAISPSNWQSYVLGSLQLDFRCSCFLFNII